jgi:hypothetical protein
MNDRRAELGSAEIFVRSPGASVVLLPGAALTFADLVPVSNRHFLLRKLGHGAERPLH